MLTRVRERRTPESMEAEGEEREAPVCDSTLDPVLLELAGLSVSSTPRAVVEDEGFVSLQLSHGVVVDVTAEQAVRVRNPAQASAIALSLCATQLAVEHPTAALLQHGPRVELQVEDKVSVKNAKVFPRGISFTANNVALVYLVDSAGARTTSDVFHDLGAGEVVDRLFLESVLRRGRVEDRVEAALGVLGGIVYWRERGLQCWEVAGVRVEQARDGMVQVERLHRGERFLLVLSPTTGRLRASSDFVQVLLLHLYLHVHVHLYVHLHLHPCSAFTCRVDDGGRISGNGPN